ncbi:hypothetical protein GLAREA_02586 [Glarea lozoyensis ATCC 20868]|uniref:Uncharacterized protein n=1 Tax=Glarea lozoyensis (strain ATCC 20868 / MF5171) TaxID=1116229 RepID=S3DJE1_GLAL2|nr:uncharacterized protein GLAREA_02586 [Glarea lozoyensis ATCC 20868]EPE26673.1 hypothetical protein GLAREA_02586 [Glarea lozoyensis ATCC 20868]
MQLTPIRVPGKRKARSEKDEKASRKAAKISPASASVKSENSQSSEFRAKGSKKRSLKSLKSRRKMSLLERLPTELLETVYLYALNINLPRASPIISGKLSSELIYHKTVIAAFGPTWEYWKQFEQEFDIHGCRRAFLDPDNSYLLFGPPKYDVDSQVVLQSNVLSCRWARTPVILKAKQIWLLEHNIPDGAIWFVRESEGVNRFRTGWENESGKLLPKEIYNFDDDFDGFSDYCLRDTPDPEVLIDYNCKAGIEHDAQLPNRILVGPWNEEDIRLLFWLLATSGMRNAISIGDTRAVVLLSWLGLAARTDHSLLRWALRNVGGNKANVITHLILSIESAYQNIMRPQSKKIRDMLDYKILEELEFTKEEGELSGNQPLANLAQTIMECRALQKFLGH